MGWNENYGGIFGNQDKTYYIYKPASLAKSDYTQWQYDSGEILTYEKWSRYGSDSKSGLNYITGNNLAQFYVPYDYFKRACQIIQSVYSKENDYAGYHNFMHYWAMNGEWDWICFTTETTDPLGTMKSVDYSYLSTNFWNNFDPNKEEGQQHAWIDCTDPIMW